MSAAQKLGDRVTRDESGRAGHQDLHGPSVPLIGGRSLMSCTVINSWPKIHAAFETIG
jgi:hypothetical protein